jgi:hypothetical protein
MGTAIVMCVFIASIAFMCEGKNQRDHEICVQRTQTMQEYEKCRADVESIEFQNKSKEE